MMAAFHTAATHALLNTDAKACFMLGRQLSATRILREMRLK
jgi:hypothetical protein